MYEIVNNALAFIGKKFDELITTIRSQPQKIDIDLGKSSKELESAAVALGVLISKMEKTQQTKAMGQELQALKDIRSEMSKLSDTVKKTAPVMDATETKKTNKLIGQLIKAVNQSFIPEVTVDMDELKQITSSINNLIEVTLSTQAYSDPRFDSMVEKLDKIASKEILIPKTVKLDNAQVRKLSNPVIPSFQGVMPANKALTANVDLDTADTEYSYTFPAETVAFYIKIRSQNTKLLMSWETGKLPTSGDGTAYFTVPQNGMQSREGLNIGGQTIYLQSSGTSQVAELMVYTV